MYSKIVLCLRESEDEVLKKQIDMLKERHHAEIERIDVSDMIDFLTWRDESILFISDDDTLLSKAKELGIAVNDPQKMKESYTKAMEMLRAMGMKR